MRLNNKTIVQKKIKKKKKKHNNNPMHFPAVSMHPRVSPKGTGTSVKLPMRPPGELLALLYFEHS